MWNRSEAPSSMSPDKTIAMTRTSVGERYQSSRSSTWTNFSQIPPSDQARFFSKLSTIWPFAWERRAVQHPLHVSLLANSATAALIATRITADLVLYEPKLPFIDASRRIPFPPLVFGVYASGVTLFMLHTIMIVPALYREVDPCASCVLSKHVLISLASGIALPMLSTPYLAYYYVVNSSDKNRFPPITKAQEMFTLCLKGNKAARPLMPFLVAFQFVVASLSAYTQLWGRNRIFATMDADPDLAKEIIIEAQVRQTMKEKITGFLRGIPLVGDVIEGESPEKDRL
ncbi:unnamed protein product, partial [Mesorhabditis spiculigera]